MTAAASRLEVTWPAQHNSSESFQVTTAAATQTLSSSTASTPGSTKTISTSYPERTTLPPLQTTSDPVRKEESTTVSGASTIFKIKLEAMPNKIKLTVVSAGPLLSTTSTVALVISLLSVGVIMGVGAIIVWRRHPDLLKPHCLRGRHVRQGQQRVVEVELGERRGGPGAGGGSVSSLESGGDNESLPYFSLSSTPQLTPSSMATSEEASLLPSPPQEPGVRFFPRQSQFLVNSNFSF
jgi:hypothetical protein